MDNSVYNVLINKPKLEYEIEVKNIICYNLEYLRKLHKFTLEHVADVIKVTKYAYHYYEKGKRDIPITTLKRLSHFYSVSLDAITSSELSSQVNTEIIFPTISYKNEKLEYDDPFMKVQNKNLSLIVVNVNDKIKKIFESSEDYVKDRELLIEFKGKMYISKVSFFTDGSGVFHDRDDSHVLFCKKDAKHLIIIGILQSTVIKEYDKEDFF